MNVVCCLILRLNHYFTPDSRLSEANLETLIWINILSKPASDQTMSVIVYACLTKPFFHDYLLLLLFFVLGPSVLPAISFNKL